MSNLKRGVLVLLAWHSERNHMCNRYILARVTSGWHSRLPECLCLNIISNFLIAFIPIFLQLLSANTASYTGIETLTSSWLPNNVWVEEELNSNLNLLQRKFRRKQGKILNRKIYSQEVSILDFNGTFLGFSVSIPWNWTKL